MRWEKTFQSVNLPKHVKPREQDTAAKRDENRAGRSRRRGLLEEIFHKLAKFFNGIHWAMGMTTLPATATSREERSFVLMWLGIIAFMIVFFAFFTYLLGSM